jgi:hypothetical protein
MQRLTAFLLAAVLAAAAAPAAAGFDHFVTVDGHRLMDGPDEFRFVSFNVPTLLYVEDEMAFEQTNPYGLPGEWALRDLFRTVVQTGGRVVRAYTIPVRNTDFPAEAVTYVEAPGRFNEDAFRAMDRALALAAEHGVRVIVPLVNNWQWMGGRPNYAAFRGRQPDDFWTDRQLIDDFKRTIEFVLTRINTVTGVAYRDDPTILAWETGNELQNPPEWALEIGAYIKRLDPRHLLIDGYHASHHENHDAWIQPYTLESPLFDIVSTHHYEPAGVDMVRNLRRTVARVGGRKPLLLGEFGFISTAGVQEVLDYVLGEPAIAGALIWSLRRHHEGGGFYHHTEPIGHGLYRAYHWPGFDAGEAYDERAVLALLRDRAFAIQGRAAPPLEPPLAPAVIPFTGAPRFSWQGSAGAALYDIQRSTAAAGPWRTVAWGVDDIATPGFALFSDTTATTGGRYFYRVVARNAAGASPPSAPFGPVTVEHLTRVDDARNLGVVADSRGVTVRSGDQRSYKEAHSRLHGEAGAWLSYTAPGELREWRVYAYERPAADGSPAAPALRLSTSADALDWRPAEPELQRFPSPEKNYDYLVPVRYRLAPPPGARYVRAEFMAPAGVVRVELDYR